MSKYRSPADGVRHLMNRFLGRRRGQPMNPQVFVEKVREFLGSGDFLCARGVPCHPRVERIERDGYGRVVDLAVRFELVGTAEPETVPGPTALTASVPRERRCSAGNETRSFSPLYHFTFRSDEAFASNTGRFRKFLTHLPPPDEASSPRSSATRQRTEGGTGLSGRTAAAE
jgi:hypothetical protein